MREVHDRPVDRREDDVEGPMTPSHPPPVAVEDRVPEVERPLTIGLDQPRDLGIAEAIDGGQCGEREGADLHPPPYLDLPASQACPLELHVGLRQAEVLDVGPSGPDWL